MVFAIFAGEGGLLDPFALGIVRATALLLPLIIEAFAAWVIATTDTPDLQKRQ